MTELNVTLDFACCSCNESVSVTVQCAGQGPAAKFRAVTSVAVPCPTCSSVNMLFFEPTGTVLAVSPFRGPRLLPEPSLN
jgi:hypothetical protein